MSSVTKILFSAVVYLGAKRRPILFLCLLCISGYFIYNQTTKRLITPSENIEKVAKMETVPQIEKSASMIPKIERKDTFHKQKKLTNPAPFNPLEVVRNYKDLTIDPVFSSFTNWLQEYQGVICSQGDNCSDHDPRYIRNLLLRGERLSRTRAKVMQKIIIGDPKSAISLGIPEQTAEKLPEIVRRNLEKWESSLANVKTAHSCFSTDHQGCEIRREAKFNDGRHMRVWTFGSRKGFGTVSNLAVWGVSIGQDFAMADTPLQVFEETDTTGSARFGGDNYTYNTLAERNYFSYLINEAERRLGSFRGGSVSYPVAMGSSSSMGSILGQRYRIVANPARFDTAYEDAFQSGSLLQIDSQEENDFICELLRGKLRKGLEGINQDFVPWVWLGATDDENQSGIGYNLSDNQNYDFNLSASEGNWKWLNGQDMNQTYSNWAGGINPPFTQPGLVKPLNHAYLNYVTGEWNNTLGPWWAGPRDAQVDVGAPFGFVDRIGDPDINLLGDLVWNHPGSLLPYVIERNLIPDHGRSQDISLKGIRKVLVIPARFVDQTEHYFSSRAFTGSNAPLTDQFGNPINPEISKQPYTPISVAQMKLAMDEVNEFFLNTTDKNLQLEPVFAPTVTIPYYEGTASQQYTGSSQFDSEGNLTGPAVYTWSAGAELSLFAESAKRTAAIESEEFDFYGPAFVGIDEVEINTTSLTAGQASYSEAPTITIEGGAFINPNTGLPHVKFQPAEAEAILNEDGNLTGIRITNPGAYYFDPDFGSRLDYSGRSIFDYNYTEDDLKLEVKDRSPLHNYRVLCAILDSDGDGFAEYDNLMPRILINGSDSYESNFSVSVDSVCITWVVATTYMFGKKYEEESEAGDGETFEYNFTYNPGIAWVGAPGAHIAIRLDENNTPSVSSRTIAHEIGHNLGLWHDQGYSSKGEHALSDEAAKIQYGNPYTIMGGGEISMGGHFSLPAQTALHEIFQGKAGYSSGGTQGVDVLEINNSADLNLNVSLKEANAPNPNTFRIYRNNFHTPPGSLREDNFSITYPDAKLSWFVNEYFGQSNSSSNLSAHENNRTASDLNLSLEVTVLGTGEDANVTLHFKNGHFPRLEILNGGRGFHKDPTLVLQNAEETESFIIDPGWVYEENSSKKAQLFNNDVESRWIRGMRIKTDAAGKGNFLPNGDDVDDNLSQYFLSYRTDSSLYGLNVLLANDPRDQFLPDRETFLIDTTPNTPNSMEDAPLLIGSTFSDYDSDIHITPVGVQSGNHISELHQLYKEIKLIKHKIETININRYSYDVDDDGDDVFTFTSEFNADLARYNTELASVYENIVFLEEKSYPFIDVVVNIGTTATAQAPEFQIFIENTQPTMGEYIEMAVVMADGNSSGYAYSWFINEQQVSNPHYLNQPVIFQPFNQPGKQVVRVVVSDMKGGFASKTLVIHVAGETPANNNSLISGSVRSSQGLMQGARVVVEKAPTFDHLVSQTGTLRDSFYPTGLNNPAQLTINGQVSPTLEFHRGEIHRFYFENEFDEAFTFLEKPEAAPPRVSVNMLADPRRSLTNFGGLYVRNPEIRYEMNSSFNTYTTELVAPFTEVTDPHGNPSMNGLHTITRPYAKALMEESNISYGRVGPLEIDEFGYVTYGGKGYDRNNIPRLEIRRVSIWEDYGDSNATGQAHVDGVGTISPVNSVNTRTGLPSFMGQAWETRKTEELNGTILPELIIWGSGGDNTGDEPDRDVNATVIGGKDEYRYIEITNQGQGYEPDGTMAVLHYPLDPFAYWTFDRHETLFENNQSSRYQPSPVWNRQLFFNDMTHRWSFDEQNGTTTIANVDKDLNYTVPPQWFPNGLSSQFGLSGRALEWNATVSNPQVINFNNALPDDNYTVSFWANPRSDFNVTLGGDGGVEYKLTYDFDTNDTNVTEGGNSILGLRRQNPQYSDWVHIALSNNRRNDEVNLYIDGRKVGLESRPIDKFGDLNFTAFDGLLDELLIFDQALQESAIKYLAGRTYLDISGNKFHISPMSDNLIPVTPGANGSSLDVPQDASFLPEAKTSADNQGRLGDTFLQENHGHSLSLNGLGDYLDLSSHKDDFSLSEGSISVWVKVNQQFNENLPILWISKPFSFTDINVTDPISGNSTIERQFDPGQYFSMDIQNGWPRIGGFVAEGLENKVNLSSEWRHVVGAFPSGKIWIDGVEVPTARYDSEGVIFSSSTNPLEFIFDADTFWIGKSSSIDQELENYYQGKIDDLVIYDRELTAEEIYFLYELRRGREQIPRLQALVDAIGTVEIIDSGSGYRENPKLVFGYGEVMDKTSLSTFVNLANLQSQQTEDNTSHGEQALVLNNDQAELVNHVYSFHMGADPSRNLSYQNQFRKDGLANGWRKHISAHGIGEYENASLGDVVWTKRLSIPEEILLPDQNTTKRRFVEYVTTDKSRSSSSEVNQTNVHNYFKPNGLYGFIQVPDTNVSEPGVHNSEATEEESAFFKAEAYILYHIDHDAPESIEIVDQGVGMHSNATLLKFNLDNDGAIKVSGRGYQPTRANLTYSKRPTFGGTTASSILSNSFDSRQYTYAPKEQWENEGELLDDADAQLLDGTELISLHGYHLGYNWSGTHDVGIDLGNTDFNQSLAEVIVDEPGFGYSVPIEVKSWGGYPEFGVDNIAGVGFDLDIMGPVPAIVYRDAQFIVTEVDENGSISKIEMLDSGTGYIKSKWDNNLFSKNTYPHFRFPSSFSITDPDANLTVTGPSGINGWAVATRPVLGYISVTGGGGMGAEIWITGLNDDGEVEGNTTHPDIVILDGGRGYYNIDPNNLPQANLVASAGVGETVANLSAKLGGYLTDIPKCKGCPGGESHHHVAPWIEIWDRGRPELRIDQLNARAHAAPKVVNGKIEKVVVTNGGSGYIDPVAIVRDIAPKIDAYRDRGASTTEITVYRRIWKCTNLRVNLDGEEEECGHVQSSLYPPDECPGETDADYPYQDENGTILPTIGLYVEGWRERHEDPEKDYQIEDPAYNITLHQYCINADELFNVTGHEHNNSTHLDVRFLSRKCWGTKENYVLLDPNYRYEPEAWRHLDANLSVVSHNGRIKEIIVEDSGDNYFAPTFIVEGSGSGVDAIPIYNDEAKMTRVIFDDPELKNLQLDTHITRPVGAGQGFRERPWAWDDTYESRSSPREKIEILTKFATAPEVGKEWAFGSPVLGDHLGDRILSVDVLDHGIYSDTTDLTPAFIDYNTSVKIAGLGLIDFNQSDFDGDGYSDFVDAQIHGIADYRLNRFFLDGNGTFEDWTEADKSLTPRGLFIEQPSVSLLDGRNVKLSGTIITEIETLEGGREVESKIVSGVSVFTDFPYMDENLSSFIRLNGQVSYDPEKDRSYVELYIDDRFPNQLYYGMGQAFADGTGVALPKMGGKILVSEGLPGKDWIFGEPAQKKYYAYTDQNGYYAISGLEPGLYNVTTMMEDERYQDLSFRTDANSSRISHLLYIPGFPDLTLVSDNFGAGTSSLVWSQESQKLSRVAGLSVEEEFDLEYLSTKRLDGIGRGFDPNGLPPVLTFIPHPENFGKTVPHVDLNVSIDGSLSLRIIDDENTSTFFPNDRFTVRYDSSVSGVDFYQSYRYSDTNKTYGSGVKASWESGSVGARLLIFPDDANGSNPIEAALSSVVTEWNPSSSSWEEVIHQRPLVLRAEVYEANGSRVSFPQVDWKLSFDFNASEGNNTMLAQLVDGSNSPGHGELNASGNLVALYLYSHLRKNKGIVKEFEIVDGGQNYQVGEAVTLQGEGYGFAAVVSEVNASNNDSILDINITHGGYKYELEDIASVTSSAGAGASLKPVFYDGTLWVEANYTLPSGTKVSKKVSISPQISQKLTAKEEWANLYLDTIFDRDQTWWATTDTDGDSLFNIDEYYLGTDPDRNDTDNDNLTDSLEKNSFRPSDPLNHDTDGDGLSDFNEDQIGTDPRLQDTDADGLTDKEEFDDPTLDPTAPDGEGLLTGRIYKLDKYAPYSPVLYYRMSRYDSISNQDILMFDWCNTWNFMEGFLNKTGLNYDLNYTVEAYLDMDDGGYDQNYSYGEPYAVQEHNLTEDFFDIRLTPSDPGPTIRIAQPTFIFDYNNTSLTNQIVLDVDANDSFYNNNTALELSLTKNTYGLFGTNFDGEYGSEKVIFLVEGNLSDYLSNETNNSKLVNLDYQNIPPGYWTLRFTAMDEHDNLSTSDTNSSLSYAELNVTIVDDTPPFITFLDHQNKIGATLFTLLDLNQSGSVSNTVLNYELNETNSSFAWEWNASQPFEFSDFNSSASTNLQVHAWDIKNDLIDDWIVTVDYNESDPVGKEQDLDYWKAIFADGNFSSFSISMDEDGKYSLPAESPSGVYRFRFQANDLAENTAALDLYLLKGATYTSTEITAVDGYLYNARVIFDGDGDGLSDLSREFLTDINGRAQISFTREEFERFDKNGNGKLDSDEGKFIVIGGFDTSTNAFFPGKLIADANSSVITPLTTMVSQLMDDGASKTEALTAIALALQLDPKIDLTTYDPIQMAFEGDPFATQVMSANLRMANLVNQAEGLLLTLSPEYQGYSVGTYLLGEIARRLNQNADAFELEGALVDAIPLALASVGIEGDISLEDQLAMFQLIAELDQSIQESEEELSFEELMDRQIDLIKGLDDLFVSMGNDRDSFTQKEYLLKVDSGVGGSASIGGLHPYGAKVVIIATAEEGYKFDRWKGLGVTDENANSTFVLMTEDRNLTALFSTQYHEVNVAIEGKGEVSGIGSYPHGEVAVLSALPGDGYYFESWFGDILNQPLNTSISITVTEPLFLVAKFSPDAGQPGPESSSQSKEDEITDLDTQSKQPIEAQSNLPDQEETNENSNLFSPIGVDFELFLSGMDFDGNGTIKTLVASDLDGDQLFFKIVSENPNLDLDDSNMFFLSGSGDLKIADTDDLLLASGSTIQMLFSVSDGQHSSSLSGVVKIAPSFILDSTAFGNGWHKSDWLGIFYTTREKWMYHHPLGWLYFHDIYPDGLWLWDDLTEAWFWTRKDFFPWLFKSGSESWIYHKLDDGEVKVFDQTEKSWKLRK